MNSALSFVKKLPQDLKRIEAEKLQGELSTEQVANFFKSRCAHLEPEMYDFPSSWGAVATHTMAISGVEGDVPQIKATTKDEYWPQNQYEWFDAQEVPNGGYLARISATGTLWSFHRRMDGQWEAYASPDFA